MVPGKKGSSAERLVLHSPTSATQQVTRAFTWSSSWIRQKTARFVCRDRRYLLRRVIPRSIFCAPPHYTYAFSDERKSRALEEVQRPSVGCAMQQTKPRNSARVGLPREPKSELKVYKPARKQSAWRPVGGKRNLQTVPTPRSKRGWSMAKERQCVLSPGRLRIRPKFVVSPIRPRPPRSSQNPFCKVDSWKRVQAVICREDFVCVIVNFDANKDTAERCQQEISTEPLTTSRSAALQMKLVGLSRSGYR